MRSRNDFIKVFLSSVYRKVQTIYRFYQCLGEGEQRGRGKVGEGAVTSMNTSEMLSILHFNEVIAISQERLKALSTSKNM